MSIVIDAARCTGCGKCVADCVCACLELREGKPTYREGRASACVHCGHCQAICPEDALSLDGHSPEELALAPEIGAGWARALLTGRRAVRQYTKDPLPQAVLDEALAISAYAPTAHNARELGYTVINGREKIELLLQQTIELMERQGLFPGIVSACKKGQDKLFRGASTLILIHSPKRVLAETDCATAAAYLELALYGLGYGSCWAGMLLEACTCELPPALSLPRGHRLYAALMAGKPKVTWRRTPWRSLPKPDQA